MLDEKRLTHDDEDFPRWNKARDMVQYRSLAPTWPPAVPRGRDALACVSGTVLAFEYTVRDVMKEKLHVWLLWWKNVGV
jgi:hypothetical protein